MQQVVGRRVFLTLCAVLISWLYLPHTFAQADCDCTWIKPWLYTCNVGGCQQSVLVSVCYGLRSNCHKCVPFYTTVPCCGHEVGDAAYFLDCGGEFPLGLGPAGQDSTRSEHASVMVPSCEGGYVRAFLPADGSR